MKNLHTTSSIQIDFNDPTEFKFGFGFAISAFNEGTLCTQQQRGSISSATNLADL